MTSSLPWCSTQSVTVTVVILTAFVSGCARRPPYRPPRSPSAASPAQRPVARPAYPTPATRDLVRVPPTPGTLGSPLDEQTVGDELPLDFPPDQPLEAPDKDEDLRISLAPQIQSAKAPNVAAALRLVDEGRVLLEQKQYSQALNRFERSVSIDPSSFYGYYYLARAHYLTHDYSQAIGFASRATALGTQTDRAWLSRAYTLQGTIFEEVGRFPDARKAYQRAVDADPANLTAYVGRARLTPRQPPQPVQPDEDSWR